VRQSKPKIAAYAGSMTRKNSPTPRPARLPTGLVVGWFQGAWNGALARSANRSILGDPRRADMKNILNLEDQTPGTRFGPSRPRCCVRRSPTGSCATRNVPFMAPGHSHPSGAPGTDTGGHPCRRNRAAANRRSRQQSKYYALIESFSRLTGVPMVLNTSFNENEPWSVVPKSFGLFPAHQNGCPGIRHLHGAARIQRLLIGVRRRMVSINLILKIC